MSQNRKLVVAYALFVILPILGLAAILAYSRSLTATVSVGGWWQLQSSSSEERLRALCVEPLPAEGISVQAVQSGKILDIKLASGRTIATGVIAGRTIKVSFPGSHATPGNTRCDNTLTLTAQLDSQKDPRAAEGSLSVDGCASCARVEFRAVRQAKAIRTKEK